VVVFFGIEFVLLWCEVLMGLGWHDFEIVVDFVVIVEEDFVWCDFMINVMVCWFDDGEFVDFYGGELDLCEWLLKIVFVNSFVEDFLWIVCGFCFIL